MSEAMGRKILLIICSTLILQLISNAQNSDCSNALRICNLDKYTFNPTNSGLIIEELSIEKNLPNIHESHSKWLFWDVKESGDFVFEITPSDKNDDIDFVLYASTFVGCSELKEVRSVLSGPNVPSYKNSESCLGNTGLNYFSKDKGEGRGCQENDDNHAKYIYALPNERYYILINNYSSSNSFEFSISGSLELEQSNCASFQKPIESSIVLDLFPNPVSSDLYITLTSENQEIEDIAIFGINGQKIISVDRKHFMNQSEHSINLNQFANGTYILHVETKVGAIQKSFVKQ